MDVILGLDVSTSRTGVSIVDQDQNLLYYQALKLNSKDSLEDRCILLEYYINSEIKTKYNISKIYIEQPFIMFSGGKTTAMTMSKLQRFNGMVSFMIRKSFGFDAELIAANIARGAIGLIIKRGENTKKKVIEWVKQKYPKDFIFELTRYGNPKPGTDDMADAIVIALAGLNLNQ